MPYPLTAEAHSRLPGIGNDGTDSDTANRG